MKTLPLGDLWDLKVKMQSLEKGILIVMDEIFSIKDIVSHPCEWLSATIILLTLKNRGQGGLWWVVFSRKHNSKTLTELSNGLKIVQDRPLKWVCSIFCYISEPWPVSLKYRSFCLYPCFTGHYLVVPHLFYSWFFKK